MRYTPSLLRKVAFSLTIFGLMISFGVATLGQSASALSGSEFNASNIIDDSVFFNKNSMSAAEVQAFLNAKLPVCDTNGTQPYAGTTRAAYGASRGYPAPYTCLKDYTQAIPAKSADAYCSGGVSAGTKSAAQIIYDVAQACGVSPKVLLILLQKEQSLVTDDWPWSIQYRSATGFGCPDTAECDSAYYGYFNQVYNAARQYRRYVVQADYFNYAAGRTSFVSYQANAPNCGGTNLTIQNGATAGLYNYTPYQPNAAALANLYGTGDSCSAYGNRNFWRMFNDWFGSVRGAAYSWQMLTQYGYTDANKTTAANMNTLTPGSRVYVGFTARNTGNVAWTNSGPNAVMIGTASPLERQSTFAPGSNWLSPTRPALLKEASVAPGGTGTFEFWMTAPASGGVYNERFNLIANGIAWFNDVGLSYYAKVN